jgi:uncharacterized protein (DUF2225 family)
MDGFETPVTNNVPETEADKTEDPMNYIYPKTFECPVCGKKFTDYVVQQSKLRLIKKDTDMKPYYKIIDPSRYDVLLCGNCGYAATFLSYKNISERQIDLIKEKVTPVFKHKETPEPRTIEDAIERYKYAMLNSTVKGAKGSEKAMFCLKIAWFYRDLHDTANESLYLKNALDGLKKAYSSENFPIISLNETSMELLIAELSRRCGEYRDAVRWASEVAVKKDIPRAIKDRAIAIKDMVKESVGEV